jgi:acyl dehydratase/NADP-dependent 3-hydroxy acid dehydrogenase YdfG
MADSAMARTFDLEDQQRFASLSGDWNPLHVDPIAARRTMFGEPVVHGVHLACWALDVAAGERGGRLGLDEVRAVFRRPTYLHRRVELSLTAGTENDVVTVTAMSGGATVLEVTARWVTGAREEEVIEASESLSGQRLPRDLARAEVAAAVGRVVVALNRGEAERLFPRLSASAPLSLAELLATSRVVGMLCPGLHSLYTGLDLHRRVVAPKCTELSYRVKAANLKYSLVSLAVEGPTLAGTLETLYRPPPNPPLSMRTVAASVTPGEFAGQRALVVGGSRGLGEAFAKAIAVGGGEVCLTYHRGSREAQLVVDDVLAAGGRASSFALDVTSPDDLRARWPVVWTPTHVYYFATPFIRIDKTASFSSTDYELFARYYVIGLHATARAICALGANGTTLWAPSTTFLDKYEGGSASYCASKAAMEELGRHLPRMLPVRVLMPRLPRTMTDQTATLIPMSSADPLRLAVEHLRMAQRDAAQA